MRYMLALLALGTLGLASCRSYAYGGEMYRQNLESKPTGARLYWVKVLKADQLPRAEDEGYSEDDVKGVASAGSGVTAPHHGQLIVNHRHVLIGFKGTKYGEQTFWPSRHDQVVTVTLAERAAKSSGAN